MWSDRKPKTVGVAMECDVVGARHLVPGDV